MQRSIIVISISAIASALLAALCSCNILGPAAFVLTPPPTQEPEYALQDRPTAVFVDDRRNALGDRPLRRYIGDRICEELLKQEVFVEHVPVRTRDVLAIVGTEERGALRPLDQIAHDVGVEVLIYVEMMAFQLDTLQEDRPLARAQVRVKVIDAVSQTRVFPVYDTETPETEDDYRNMLIDLPSEIAFKPQLTRASAREAEMALCEVIADRVAKLFYEHEIRPLGGQLDTSQR